jgi:glutamate-1-semialdehyde 2,1-aminomutase
MSLTERYAAAFLRSRRLHERARGFFPDGVTHDLRRLEPFPVYIDRARGARKWDVGGLVVGRGAVAAAGRAEDQADGEERAAQQGNAGPGGHGGGLHSGRQRIESLPRRGA